MMAECKNNTFVTCSHTGDTTQMVLAPSHKDWCQKCPAISAAEVQE